MLIIAIVYSPMTMATAAFVPQVESQSLQPTRKPAYSPTPRRAKLYWPPLRGIIAPNSAMEEAPTRAYRPPNTHTPRNSQGWGSCRATLPGVRTMPAAIVLPMAAAMPNHTPRTCNSRPLLCAAAVGLLEEASAVVDNRILERFQESPSYWRLAELQAPKDFDCRETAAKLRPQGASVGSEQLAIEVSVVIPCLNEVKSVGFCIEKALRAFASAG